jgi:hypothetical protein
MTNVRSGHRHLIVTIAPSNLPEPMSIFALMPTGFLVSTTLLVASAIAACGANDSGKAAHVVVVWTGCGLI